MLKAVVLSVGVERNGFDHQTLSPKILGERDVRYERVSCSG